MKRATLSPQLFVLLAFATLAAAPLTAPGYFMLAHDSRHTVYFMQMFDAALRDGALFPRWAGDMVFGYGYPLWIILAPLPYYGAEFFHLLGLDLPSSIKAVEAVGWYASALGMYLFVSRVMDRNAGLVAGVAYLFVPYHVVDLYVRGALAEFLAFVFPPLILWGIFQIFAARRWFYAALTALAYGGMLLTHVQMTVLISPVVAGYILVLWLGARQTADRRSRMADDGQSAISNHKSEIRDQKSPISTSRPLGSYPEPTNLRSPVSGPLVLSFTAILWGVALAAIFFVPILMEQRYLTSDPLIGGFFNFRLHFLNPEQLFSTFWGYGYAGIHGSDQFSLQLGVMPLFFAAVALFTVRRGDAVSVQLVYFALVTVAAAFAMLPVSAPVWELAAPIVAFTQFPWRVLFVSAVALSFLSGASVRIMKRSDQFLAALVFVFLLAFALFPYARPQYTGAQFSWNTLMDFQVKDRELLGDTVWVQARPQDSPLVAQYLAGNITTKAVVLEGDAVIELVERRPSGDTVHVNAATPSRIQFYTRYFPGWSATVDGVTVPVAPSGEQGLIAVDVPAGAHTVATRWGTTMPRLAGAVISFLALGAVVLVLARGRRG